MGRVCPFLFKKDFNESIIIKTLSESIKETYIPLASSWYTDGNVPSVLAQLWLGISYELILQVSFKRCPYIDRLIISSFIVKNILPSFIVMVLESEIIFTWSGTVGVSGTSWRLSEVNFISKLKIQIYLI